MLRTRDRYRMLIGLTAALAIAIGATGVGAADASASRTRQLPPAWVTRSGGDGRSTDWPAGIAVADHGTTIVDAATSMGSDRNRNILTVAIDATTGEQRWTSSFDGTAGKNDRAVGIAAVPDGSRVFVLGTTVNGSTKSDYVVLAYDVGSGTLAWSTTLDGKGERDDAAAIGISPDGGTIFVTGNSSRDDGLVTMTAAYTAGSGFLLWERDYLGTLTASRVPIEEATALAVSPDGREVFVAGDGYTYVEGWESGRAYDVVAYGAFDGIIDWTARPLGGACSYPYPRSIAVSPDGRLVALTGSADDGCNVSFPGYATAAIDAATGATAWISYMTGETWTRTWGATAIAFTPDGRSVVQTGGLLSPHIGTVAYDPATGKRRWTTSYNGGGSDLALAVASTLDSRSVVVTGFSRAPTGDDDLVTIAYRAGDGGTSWTAHWDDGERGSDGATAIAMAPDGSAVYVTGWTTGGAGGSDVVTLAYSL